MSAKAARTEDMLVGRLCAIGSGLFGSELADTARRLLHARMQEPKPTDWASRAVEFLEPIKRWTTQA